MFIIKDVDFKSNNYGTDEFLTNWPMLYILENGQKAYVGQTNNIYQRMSQHKQSPSKQAFTKAHFIYYDRSTQSATFDYESQLISLMAADNKYIITNLNAGLSGLNYFDKKSYDEDFKHLWRELQSRGLAEKSIEELQQSDLFKYSPFKQLSTEQRNLVSEITDSLKRSLDRKIIVEGMPGSGKTILAIYLFKLLRESPEFRHLKVAFVVPPSSLRKTIKSVFKTINGLSTKDVIGPNDVATNDYDIILVDESHRLKMRKNLSSYTAYDDVCNLIGLPTSSTQMDWILEKSKCAIFFYDKNQIVFPQGLQIHKLINEDPYDHRMLSSYILYSQMRCLGGIDYLTDLSKLFHEKLENKVRHDNYQLAIIDDFQTFNDLCVSQEEKVGLCRMVAGYAWKWNTKDNPNTFDIEIDGIQKKWNSTLENWVNSPNASNEVGCIHSVQGYDLNYGFVIIGNDLRYDKVQNKIVINKDSYFDKYGKNNTTPETLEEYIKNIYYVLMTRGVKGTYLYICDSALKEYMKKFIQMYSSEVMFSSRKDFDLLVANSSPKYGK